MKRSLRISAIFQSVIVVAAALLLVTFAAIALVLHERQAGAILTRDSVAASRELFRAMQDLRVERGTINTLLASPDAASEEELRDVALLRTRSNQALDRAWNRISRLPVSVRARLGMADTRIAPSRAALAAMRPEVDAAARLPREKRPAGLGPRWVAAQDALVNALSDQSEALTGPVARRDAEIGRLMAVKRTAWSARATAGTDRLRLAEALARGARLTPGEVETFAQTQGAFESDLRALHRDIELAGTEPSLAAAVRAADRAWLGGVRQGRREAIAALAAGGEPPFSGRAWVERTNPALASVMLVAREAFDLAEFRADQQVRFAARMYFGAIALMVLILIGGVACAAFLVQRFVTPMARINQAMRRMAQGDLNSLPPMAERNDEIGELAQALATFRDNALAAQAMQAQLVQSQVEREAAESANRMKSQFLANMSHELRTPLNGMLGMAQVMQLKETSPEKQDELKVVIDSGNALLTILGDLLDVSRIEAGEMSLTREPFEVEPVARAALAVFEEAARAKGLAISCAVRPEAGGRWLGDPVRVRQILLNLISNAVKFTAEGAVAVEIGAGPGGLLLSVRDTGIGIAPEAASRLFEKFWQADESHTRAYGGTGLGLSIVRQLAELMGGTVSVDSQPGRGSVFTASLPLPRAAAVVEAAGPQPCAADPEPCRRLRILAAEDNPTNQRVLAALLQPLDADLTIVDNGHAAVAACHGEPWDLILMDIQMPGMDGVDATRFIRVGEAERGATPAPILAVTANVMTHQIDEYFQAGMNGCVAKPVSAQALYSAMDEALSARVLN